MNKKKYLVFIDKSKINIKHLNYVIFVNFI